MLGPISLLDPERSRSIYVELADQYKVMDAASNVAKRHVLAEHLQEVIKVLERKVSIRNSLTFLFLTFNQGDQIASLYDLLTFKDKNVKDSNVPPSEQALREERRLGGHTL